jgi:hypothetical protein
LSDLNGQTIAILSCGLGLTRGSAERLFDSVSDRSNWKLPVDGYVWPEQREAMEQAIIFFTGSVPVFTSCEVCVNCGMLHVTAGGYYEAVGA